MLPSLLDVLTDQLQEIACLRAIFDESELVSHFAEEQTSDALETCKGVTSFTARNIAQVYSMLAFR